MRVEVERTYAAPRERVFERYTDHAGWTSWAGAGKVTLERRGDQDDNGVGCIRVITNPGVVVREEVIVFERPERMVYRLLDNPGLRDHEGEVLFEDLGGDRTRLVWRVRGVPRVAATGWVMEKGLRFFFNRVLRRLSRAL